MGGLNVNMIVMPLFKYKDTIVSLGLTNSYNTVTV